MYLTRWEDIANYAEKVVVLNSGHVYKYADTEEVFADAQNLDEMGLGSTGHHKSIFKT